MLSLSTAQKYSFEVDGKPYMLPALTFDDVKETVEVMSAAPEAQYDALRGFLEKRTDKRTMQVIGKLALVDIFALFKDWTGVQGAVTPGESEGSPEL